MALLKRFYMSKRNQFVIFTLLLIFMIYYTIHGGIYNIEQDVKRVTSNLMSSEHNSLDLKIFRNKLKEIGKSGMLLEHTHSNRRFSSKNTELNLNERESVIQYVERTLEEALKEDKGTGCEVPNLDPFAKEVMQFNKDMGSITCSGVDWVKCYMSKCRVNREILRQMPNLQCIYRDIIYDSDNARHIGPPVVLHGDHEYELRLSDFVKIKCHGTQGITALLFGSNSWSGHGIGFRSTVHPRAPPAGREDTVNVLIFGFDSTSKNGFIRKMPKSYKILTEELGATVLNGYNIVGDGTPAALFPILTGKTELELPEARKSIKNSGHMDQMPFIFYKLKKDGYRTAYFEDMPGIGTFQYRFNGFKHQPADHYLRVFYLEEGNDRPRGSNYYCVGDTPRFQLMMNITDQFLKLDGKRFIFTFIADITHDDFNYIGAADEPTAEFLRGLLRQGVLKNTLLFVMGDHGPRYASVRDTFQGKLEERLPLMAIRLPEVLKAARPDIQKNLETNADALTTPHDIYATVLDALDMTQHWNPYKVNGADLPRGLTLLEPISRNRSCSEAAIEPHWCACLKWRAVAASEPVYRRVADALVDHINSITEPARAKCLPRTLTSIQWVMKKLVNQAVLQFKQAKDDDGYVGKFGAPLKVNKEIYQVKLTVGPGSGIYEAAVTHYKKEDTFHISTRDISRTNAYNNEPSCISDVYPHMNMYCYCA